MTSIPEPPGAMSRGGASTMETGDPNPRRVGILLRTALLSWMVAIVTILIFVVVIIPEQKRTFLQNLESKAHGVTVSLRDVAAGAVVNEDYSTVVDHCVQMLKGDLALDYLVITRNDGFSMIHDRAGWRAEANVPADWRPEKRETRSGIGIAPLFERRAFNYSNPFDYSGIRWGWIHVGLSLEGYDRSVASVYQRTGLLAVLCIVLSLVASFIYAKRLVRPILNLQTVVREVAGGDLSARAVVQGGDEIGSLAQSVNSMTEALLQRDRILQSVRFAAQQFLATTSWEAVIADVLAKIGQAAGISRIHIIENRVDAEGRLMGHLRVEWLAPGIGTVMGSQDRREFPWHGEGFDACAEAFTRTEILRAHARELGEAQRRLLEPHDVQSLLGIPITVANAWWGVLCLEECGGERVWTDAELDSLRAAADMLGATIQRNQTQDALVMAKEAAEAASLAKSQFLANMSHEIRTPITGVIGMLQLLHRMDLDKKQGRYVANALFSAEALMNVIGDVLDFSKIEAGKMELEEKVFSLSEVMDSTVRMFAERAERKGVELAYRLGDSLPDELVGDPNRLRQVLVNLVGNAVKFTENGEIIVSCDGLETSPQGTLVRFEVRDNGCGIGREQQALIFDAFSQADNSMSRFHGGTGLGLAISRQLCELMGGGIGVESELGKGATFWFTVRCRENGGNGTRRAEDLLDLKSLRVLVVEDCVLTREIFQDYIRSWKGQVDVAPNGAAGLEKLREARAGGQPFHVAVLDWRMPGMDGVSMARAVKADAELARTGLVLMSSFAQIAESEELMAAGFAACIPKPLSRSDLYDAIMTAANRDSRRSRDACRWRGRGIEPALPRASGTILLAEDNEINREVATELITGLGYRCRSARTGREAVEAVRDAGIHLVLMDCQMPEMDGYEATRLIRLRERDCPTGSHGGRIPIVALTAHATKSDRDRCLEMGMDDYLTKPLDPGELARTLRKWIQGNGSSVEGESVAPAPPSGAVRDDGSGIIDYPSLLDRCMGKEDLAERLLRLFVEKTREELPRLELALAANDAATLAALAHGIKGAAGSVSAMPLWETASRLETMGSAGSLEQAPDLVRSLRRQLRLLGDLLDPDADSRAEPEAAQTAEKPRGFHGTRILLVEDNPVNQMVAQHSLLSVGCEVGIASNGQEALDALELAAWDLVLMDCQMPVLDGYEATRIIREREGLAARDNAHPGEGPRHIPIIALTGQTMPGDRERCLAAGMDDYISKPFQLGALLALLNRWLPAS